MHVSLALVHHANQYVITDGYDNRSGLMTILGAKESKIGLSRVLELHRIHKIPANLHISGTLLEAIAGHQPAFLLQVQQLYSEGLIEFVGGCYGQNVMSSFGYGHNSNPLNEELQLYQIHLGVDPCNIKTFWPPERLWDTERMASILKDPSLTNRGYQYALIDDRLLLPLEQNPTHRLRYDRDQHWDSQLFQIYWIQEGHGLVALPMAKNLRQSIPPRGVDHWRNVESQLRWLSTLDPGSCVGDLIAIYGDDMEKAAGVGGWDQDGCWRFEVFLYWIRENAWIKAVKLSEWAANRQVAGTRTIHRY